jgi:hypothetical protein
MRAAGRLLLFCSCSLAIASIGQGKEWEEKFLAFFSREDILTATPPEGLTPEARKAFLRIFYQCCQAWNAAFPHLSDAARSKVWETVAPLVNDFEDHPIRADMATVVLVCMQQNRLLSPDEIILAINKWTAKEFWGDVALSADDIKSLPAENLPGKPGGSKTGGGEQPAIPPAKTNPPSSDIQPIDIPSQPGAIQKPPMPEKPKGFESEHAEEGATNLRELARALKLLS